MKTLSALYALIIVQYLRQRLKGTRATPVSVRHKAPWQRHGAFMPSRLVAQDLDQLLACVLHAALDLVGLVADQRMELSIAGHGQC